MPAAAAPQPGELMEKGKAAVAKYRGKLPLPLGYYNTRGPGPCEQESDPDALERLTATGLDNAADGGPDIVSVKQLDAARYEVVERSYGENGGSTQQPVIYQILSPTSFSREAKAGGARTSYHHCHQARVPGRLKF